MTLCLLVRSRVIEQLLFCHLPLSCPFVYAICRWSARLLLFRRENSSLFTSQHISYCSAVKFGHFLCLSCASLMVPLLRFGAFLRYRLSLIVPPWNLATCLRSLIAPPWNSGTFSPHLRFSYCLRSLIVPCWNLGSFLRHRTLLLFPHGIWPLFASSALLL
jgi:hypothetical protein